MTSTTTAGTPSGTSPTMSSAMAARGWHPGPPLLGLFAGWVALFSWSGMVAKPSDFLMPTLFVGLLMALAGSGLRMLPRRAVRRGGRAGRDRAAVPERDLRRAACPGSA